MSGIYFDEDGAHLKTWSASTKSGRTVISIQIEVTDPYELSHIFRQLQELQVNAPPPASRRTAARSGRASTRAAASLPARTFPLLLSPPNKEDDL